MRTLRLSNPLRKQIEDAARAASPRECCGLIEGVRASSSLRVTALHPTRNVAADPDRFEVDPVDHFQILHAAHERGREVIGCYHSHPGGDARPSPHDHAGAGEEGFVWLIASLSADGEAKLNAFVWRSGTFEPIIIDRDQNE